MTDEYSPNLMVTLSPSFTHALPETPTAFQYYPLRITQLEYYQNYVKPAFSHPLCSIPSCNIIILRITLVIYGMATHYSFCHCRISITKFRKTRYVFNREFLSSCCSTTDFTLDLLIPFIYSVVVLSPIASVHAHAGHHYLPS